MSEFSSNHGGGIDADEVAYAVADGPLLVGPWRPKSFCVLFRGQSCSWEGGVGRGACYYFGETK